MMIQLGHARDSDFQNELYDPIKKSISYTEHTWIFPHDDSIINSRETLKIVDLFIAEVSNTATGLGIELGFASAYGKRILCISRSGSKISSSLKFVTNDFIEYEGSKDMIEKISNFLRNL